MGRTSRQQRRAQARRISGKNVDPRRKIWQIVAGAALVLVVAGLILWQVVGGSGNAASGKTIDGITCGLEQTSFHAHAGLTILDRGQSLLVPQSIGTDPNSSCLYWFHTHDNSGTIHIEGPAAFQATLGKFFDIWGEPLSRNRASFASAKAARNMRVYVNQRLYTGDPRKIVLRDRMSVTVETGPPFSKPKKFSFNGV